MANPNIVNVTSIYGNTSYLIPGTTAATTWTALTPASNTVNKIDNIVASNVTASNATVTVAINSAAAGAGTNYRLIYQVPVPVNASIVIVDKSTAFYLGEAQSIVVTVGTASAIELTAGPSMLRTNAENIYAFTLNNYTSATREKPFTYYGFYVNTTSDVIPITLSGYLDDTTAITSIVFDRLGTDTFAGGTVELYGVN